MLPCSKHEPAFKPLVVILNVLAFVGALASMFVVLGARARTVNDQT